MTRAATLCAGLALTACAGGDIFDDIESKSWDALAGKVSAYCETVDRDDLWIQRSRIEARREIRQRGTGGPVTAAPAPPELDAATALGAGPVMIIWCAGEATGDGEPYPVPDEVWRGMVRDWRD